MNEYKHPHIGFIWYLILLAPIVAFFADYSSSTLTMCCFGAFALRFFLYLSSKKRAQNIIAQFAAELVNIKTLQQLKNLASMAIRRKETLRMYLLQMIAEKMDHLTVTPHQMSGIIANGRPCYYNGPIIIAKKKKKKEDNSIYYDISDKNSATLYIFGNNVEWLQAESHGHLPIKNILSMSLENGGTILSLVRRGQGAPAYFYTSNTVIIMKIIEQIQNK